MHIQNITLSSLPLKCAHRKVGGKGCSLWLEIKIGCCHFKQMKAQLLNSELHALLHNYRYSDLSSTPSRAL